MAVHRYLAAASVLLLSISSGRAFAQGFEGLDLTDDGKKDEKKKDPPKDELDLTAPEKPKASAAKKDEARKPLKADQPAVERDVTQDDRVKSVQRKLYIKRGRFELAPAAIINVNDPYYTRLGGQIRAAFYPADTLAIAARFAIMQTLPSDDVRQATRTLQSRIFFSVPYWNAMADLEWSPLYGKVSFFNSILHLDGYLLAGGGVVFTERTGTPDPANNDQPRPINPAFDLGIGLRFVAKDFFAVNLGLVNTTYVDTPRGTTKGVTQNLMMLTVGVSLFFPFKSTYREAE
ncbi:MAG: outer membrane beta-barrel domain-containing protein [Myxococcaceae bacterium]|nr:outer membrane beta-barrel domain-containing protein [Myxococcaceae bacterium]